MYIEIKEKSATSVVNVAVCALAGRNGLGSAGLGSAGLGSAGVALFQLCCCCYWSIFVWELLSLFFNYHLHIAKQMPPRGGFHHSEDF